MDPDQLASQKPADLELHCFKKLDISGVNMLKFIDNYFFRILQHLKMKMLNNMGQSLREYVFIITILPDNFSINL